MMAIIIIIIIIIIIVIGDLTMMGLVSWIVGRHRSEIG